MHLIENRVYAIKEIVLDDKDIAKAQLHNSKVLREIQLLSSLSHPNIVKYYTCWFEEFQDNLDTDESSMMSGHYTWRSESDIHSVQRQAGAFGVLALFIQMEYCENKTLAEFLERTRGPLGGSVAFKMFNEILQGLHEIHANNIVHRDLK